MTYIGSLSNNQSSSSGVTGNPFSMGSSSLGGIAGLVSGINTDSIVNGLMQAADMPLVQLLQQRQIAQWQQEDYQRVNMYVTNLQNSVTNMKLQSSFMVQQVTSSNSALVSGVAGPFTPNGTYNVSVKQLAQGATISSSVMLSTASNYGDTKLANLPGNPLQVNSTVTSASVTINGEPVTYNPQTDTINTILSKIQSDTKTGVSGFYDPNAGQVVLQSVKTGSSATINVTGDSNNLFANVFKINPASPVTSSTAIPATLSSAETLEINGVKISLTAGESMGTDSTSPTGTVVGDINAQSATTGVTANYDTTSGKLTLTPVSNSTYAPISVSDPNNAFALPASDAAGRDAIYTVNGYTSSSPTNNPTFNGLALNLQGTTGNNSVNVTVSPDTNAIVQTITNFVQQYNTTLQVMQGLYNQQRNYDYQPLTSQQETQMTQTQVDEWNQKAQSGVLQNDTLLSQTMNGMTSAMSLTVGGQSPSTVNGKPVTLQSLSDIGISPIDPYTGMASGNVAPGVTTTGWNTYGLLQINTAQLTAAVQADPQSVMRMFTNNPNLPGGSGDASQTGIAVQLYTSLSSSLTLLQNQAGTGAGLNTSTVSADPSTWVLPSVGIDPNGDLNSMFSIDSLDTSSIGNQINDMDSRALDMQNQLNDLRTRYQNEFSQMEQAMASLNSQSGAFSSMLGGQSSSGG